MVRTYRGPSPAQLAAGSLAPTTPAPTGYAGPSLQMIRAAKISKAEVPSMAGTLRSMSTPAQAELPGASWQDQVTQAGVGAGLVVLGKRYLPTAAGAVGGLIAAEAASRGDEVTNGRYGGLTDLGIPGPGIVEPGGFWDWGVPGPGVFASKDLTEGMHGGVLKSWVANGAVFQSNQDGTISVRKKDGRIKTYKPYKPVVFGKKLDAVKLAKVAKKHRKVYKELHKLFGTRTRTVKA